MPVRFPRILITFVSERTRTGYEYTHENRPDGPVHALLQEKDIRRVKVYNILTSGDWAAIHS